MIKRFKTRILEEAFEFVQNQDLKVRILIQNSLKNLPVKSGNSGLYILEFNTDSWHFGRKMAILKLLFSLRTESLRKRAKWIKKRLTKPKILEQII